MALQRAPAQALVEFALTLLLFLVLTLGALDLARAYLASSAVSHAARETGRHAAAHVPGPGWADTAVALGRAATVGVDPTALTLTVTHATVNDLPMIVVRGTYPFHPLTPLIGRVIGQPLLISTETTTPAY